MPKSIERCEEIKAEMREKILKKSILYFAKNGFSGTKISELSKHIGIGQGTIYIYFQSKEELFQEIQHRVNQENDLKQIKLLAQLPLPAYQKIKKLSQQVLHQLQTEENFSAMIALNTQLTLEQGANHASEETTYQTELYQYTAKMIEQGQKEGSVAAGNALKLADYYWGVVYLYALKKLFTTQYEMITADDLNRTVLKGKE